MNDVVLFIIYVLVQLAWLVVAQCSHDKLRQYLTQQQGSNNGYQRPHYTFRGSAKNAFQICHFGVVWKSWGTLNRAFLQMLFGQKSKQIVIWAWLYFLSWVLFIVGMIGMVYWLTQASNAMPYDGGN